MTCVVTTGEVVVVVETVATSVGGVVVDVKLVVVVAVVETALTVLVTVAVDVEPGASQEQKPLMTLVATLSSWASFCTFGAVVVADRFARRNGSSSVTVTVLNVVVDSLSVTRSVVVVVVVVVAVNAMRN